MDRILTRFFGLKKRFKKARQEFKGSVKDPLFCLSLGSAVLLALLALAPAAIWGSVDEKVFLASLSRQTNQQNNNEEGLLTGSIKKIWSESPEFLLVGKNSLMSAAPPSSFSPQVLGALVGGFELEDVKKTIVEYEVEPGDSLWSIADKFNVSLETVLWANDLDKNSLLQPGQKLVILPVSGTVHHIKSGDTVSEIAERYKSKVDEIIAFNSLVGQGDIYIGDILIIPNGVMPQVSTQYAPNIVPIANSYFICPVASPCRVTQGLHWYNAIDFSHGQCGEPVYAAAGGQVLKVKLTNSASKWAFGGAGNHLTILHPNGVVTMYGHIAKSLVSPGESVFQGQAVALMGGQPGTAGAGLSTGCHVHFGVSGARNPFNR